MTQPSDYALLKSNALLALRLLTLVLLVALLTVHFRSVRVFRWEQSVSGGLLVTFTMAVVGLALCTNKRCGGFTFQLYICAMGAILLILNAGVMWQRWHYANAMTRVVAELLETMGVPLQRHVITKVWLSVAAAVAMFADLLLTPILRSAK